MLALASLLTASWTGAQPQTPQPKTTEQQARVRQVTALLEGLHPVGGDVAIPSAKAVLRLGKDYEFIPADEAKRVLVEGWGNHPDASKGVLGLVFPAGKTFIDDTWGAVISYEPTGYVTDEDAKSADYDALVTTIQSGEKELNAERGKQGYPAQHFVGWAQAPSYEPGNHSVVWAQNIQFAGQAENTLNYDVRLLGRGGVLSLNMITGMSKLAETRTAAEKFAKAAEFKPGSRYADYQPGTDAKADYGVAGLVAAGVGAAAAKKLGLLAVILAFGKKFIILILAALGLFGVKLKNMFSKRRVPQDEWGDRHEAGEQPALADEDSGARAEDDRPQSAASATSGER